MLLFLGLLCEWFHLFFMYTIFIIPFITKNPYYIKLWMGIVLFMNLTWYMNNQQCILTQLETKLGKKNKYDTLTCRYALLTQKQKKKWSRVLLLIIVGVNYFTNFFQN